MKKKYKKIVCITGTRADYPRVKNVLFEINKRNSLDLKIIVTGSHLLNEYGSSIKEIKSDGFKINAKVHMFVNNYDTPSGMAIAASNCINGLVESLEKLKPDLVLLTVDRVETLAAAVAVSLMNIPIAHIQGGELTGTIDESIRHAVTKLSHFHFPATREAARRIMQLGENKKNIFTYGCPYIDIIKNTNFYTKEVLTKKFKINFKKKVCIFTQHAVTTEYGQSSSQISNTLGALKDFSELEVVSFFSNTDAGGKEIIRKIKKMKNFLIIPNMESKFFLSLMSHASIMVGNSSAAIREAPSFKLPAVNIGTRQQGRLRAKNVIDVDHNVANIKKAIRTALYDKKFIYEMKKIKNPYGNGSASKKIADKIEKLDLSHKVLQKEFIDHEFI